jgi:quercetin dioxygenase-like cupin family protein
MKRIVFLLIVAALPFGVAFAQTAPQPIVAPLMQKDLADMPGREMLMLSVEYPPGTVEHIHRHDAYAFVYVLEGTIVEGVKGGKEVTLTPGQTFYEGPNDVHTIGRNASTTRPAKVRRGIGEEEGRRRGAARRVVLAFLESDPLAMAKGQSRRACCRTCRGLRDEHERDRTHTLVPSGVRACCRSTSAASRRRRRGASDAGSRRGLLQRDLGVLCFELESPARA